MSKQNNTNPHISPKGMRVLVKERKEQTLLIKIKPLIHITYTNGESAICLTYLINRT